MQAMRQQTLGSTVDDNATQARRGCSAKSHEEMTI
jgi:hypothetical protein